MTNLQPIGCGNEFTAIPKTHRRLKRQKIYRSAKHSDDPAYQIVNLEFKTKSGHQSLEITSSQPTY